MWDAACLLVMSFLLFALASASALKSTTSCAPSGLCVAPGIAPECRNSIPGVSDLGDARVLRGMTPSPCVFLRSPFADPLVLVGRGGIRSYWVALEAGAEKAQNILSSSYDPISTVVPQAAQKETIGEIAIFGGIRPRAPKLLLPDPTYVREYADMDNVLRGATRLSSTFWDTPRCSVVTSATLASVTLTCSVTAYFCYRTWCGHRQLG